MDYASLLLAALALILVLSALGLQRTAKRRADASHDAIAKDIQRLFNDLAGDRRIAKIKSESQERYERRLDVLTVHLTTIAWRELKAIYGPQGIRLGIMTNMRSDSYSIVFYNRQNVGIDVVTAPNELDLIDTLHNEIAAYLMIEQSIKEADIPAEDPYDV